MDTFGPSICGGVPHSRILGRAYNDAGDGIARLSSVGAGPLPLLQSPSNHLCVVLGQYRSLRHQPQHRDAALLSTRSSGEILISLRSEGSNMAQYFLKVYKYLELAKFKSRMP